MLCHALPCCYAAVLLCCCVVAAVPCCRAAVPCCCAAVLLLLCYAMMCCAVPWLLGVGCEWEQSGGRRVTPAGIARRDRPLMAFPASTRRTPTTTGQRRSPSKLCAFITYILSCPFPLSLTSSYTTRVVLKNSKRVLQVSSVVGLDRKATQAWMAQSGTYKYLRSCAARALAPRLHLHNAQCGT